MKALVFYRPKTEHESEVLTYVRDFGRAHPEAEIELVDLNSREGARQAEVYGIMQYPAILALKEDDGSVINLWQGQPLPLMDELAAHVVSL